MLEIIVSLKGDLLGVGGCGKLGTTDEIISLEVTFMFRKLDDFFRAWDHNREGTSKVLANLTDASLARAVDAEHRTIGRIAWHIVQTLPEMGNQTGLEIGGPDPKTPVPQTAAAIKTAYDAAAQSVRDEVASKWDDATLEKIDNLYGEDWPRGLTLRLLMEHEIHHRGQLTVLMRQAGLKVPGIFGPSKEEWSQHGAPPPEI